MNATAPRKSAVRSRRGRKKRAAPSSRWSSSAKADDRLSQSAADAVHSSRDRAGPEPARRRKLVLHMRRWSSDASSLAAEVRRLEDANRELEARSQALSQNTRMRRAVSGEVRAAVASDEERLRSDILRLDELRAGVAAGDDADNRREDCDRRTQASIRKTRSDTGRSGRPPRIRRGSGARGKRSRASGVHLHRHGAGDARQCCSKSEELERQGAAVPDARVICADEPDESSDEDGVAVVAPVDAAASAEADETPAESADVQAAVAAVATRGAATLSAEEAITTLRNKIERLGPVNILAIEQHEELEKRYAFLSEQRRDLVDSIAQTAEAIKRIDETTKERFVSAFAAINRNFQEIFGTLFGGGRAGLTLLDENDPLESGIEIVAQPGKSACKSVQLLSGGEGADAISLMFGLFRHKPSPFCLLDEIDAPLDDANIGRFVEMLRSIRFPHAVHPHRTIARRWRLPIGSTVSRWKSLAYQS